VQYRHTLFDYHQSMLIDRERLAAFERAIRKAVPAGGVVVDVGAGTGILSMMACRAGARRVYAIERGEIAEIAAEVIRANAMSDRITLLRGHSNAIVLPEPADVVVSEVIGNAGVDEGILGTLIDARERFLKREGTLIPRQLRVCVAPVEMPETYEGTVDFWRSSPAGFDFEKVAAMAANEPYRHGIHREALRGTPSSAFTIDLERATEPFAEGTCTFRIDRSCEIHGLALWFEAELVSGEILSNAPPNRTPNWAHFWLPVCPMRTVAEGDEMFVRLSTWDGYVWRWQTRFGGEGAHGAWDTDQSNFSSIPISLETLRPATSGFRPEPSPQSEAARTVLGWFGEGRSIVAIVAELVARYPDQFPTEAAARAFAGELAQFYASHEPERGSRTDYAERRHHQP
jgi:hypothetical protein